MSHYPLLLHGDALDILPTLMAGTVSVVSNGTDRTVRWIPLHSLDLGEHLSLIHI